jgi:hypothetical protein
VIEQNTYSILIVPIVFENCNNRSKIIYRITGGDRAHCLNERYMWVIVKISLERVGRPERLDAREILLGI